MGAYIKSVKSTFWTDSKVHSLTKEAKLLFIHLITSPQGNLSGAWEQAHILSSFYTGLPIEEVERAIDELDEVGLIRYDRDTSEVLLLNYSKHNWGCSPKVRANIRMFAEAIKSKPFSEFVFSLIEDAEEGAKKRDELINDMKYRRNKQ